MPLDDELFRKHFLVADKELHEGGSKLAHLSGVALSEVENDGLQEVLDADFAVLLNEVQECLFMGFPALYDVVCRVLGNVEQTADEDPVAKLCRNAERSAGLAE